MISCHIMKLSSLEMMSHFHSIILTHNIKTPPKKETYKSNLFKEK